MTPVPRVALLPVSATVTAGSSVTVQLQADNLSTAFSVSVDVIYDPAILEYRAFTEGSFLNRNGADPTAVLVAIQDDQPGRLIIGITRLGTLPDVTGTGTVITLAFRALISGSTALTLTTPRAVQNAAGQEVAVGNWENATVTVQ